jgi:hypothetical protein
MQPATGPSHGQAEPPQCGGETRSPCWCAARSRVERVQREPGIFTLAVCPVFLPGSRLAHAKLAPAPGLRPDGSAIAHPVSPDTGLESD